MAVVILSPKKRIAIAALQSGTEARMGPLRAAPIFSMPMKVNCRINACMIPEMT